MDRQNTLNYTSAFSDAASFGGHRPDSGGSNDGDTSSLGSEILAFTDLETDEVGTSEAGYSQAYNPAQKGVYSNQETARQTHRGQHKDDSSMTNQEHDHKSPDEEKKPPDEEKKPPNEEKKPPDQTEAPKSKLSGLVGDVLRITGGSEDLHQHSEEHQLEQEIQKMVKDENREKETVVTLSSAAPHDVDVEAQKTDGKDGNKNVSEGKRLWKKVKVLVDSGMLIDSESDPEISEEERRERKKSTVPPSSKNYLRLAVSNDSPTLVTRLLDRSSSLNIYNALISSISLGRDHITMIFLEHPKYEVIHQMTKLMKTGALHTLTSQREQADDIDQDAANNDDVLTSDVTPLMLAAQLNQFDVVKALLDKGEEIEIPHSFGCSCDVCKQHPDQLRQAKTRLNAYRAIVSDSHVVLANQDPILVSFQLHQKLTKLATQEKHFKSEYLQLAEQCGMLPQKLLDKVRDGDELDILLDEKFGSGQGAYDYLARLKLAIDKQQKPFVAHPSCQKQLASIWLGSLDPSLVDSSWKSVLFLLGLTVSYPFLVLFYWIYPRNSIGKFLNIPVIKFGAATCSYIIFICLVVGHSITEKPTDGMRLSAHSKLADFYREYSTNDNSRPIIDSFIRPEKIGLGSILLCLWIMGLIWEDIKQMYKEKSGYFRNDIYNIVDVIMLSFFFISFVLRFSSIRLLRNALVYFEDRASWDSLLDKNATAEHQMDLIVADRSHWDSWDLFILSEAIFSVASLLSIARLTHIFTVSERLGPLLISLAKMIEDMFAFMVLFVFIICSFVVAFHTLYWYYYSSAQDLLKEQANNRNKTAFNSVSDVVHNCYWSIFGLMDLDDEPFGKEDIPFATSVTGHVIFSFYDWLMIIILINMLIAMMSRTYGVIAEKEDIEWKFARTKLYMDYIRAGSTLPTPFNLVPTWKGLYLLSRGWADGCCRRCAGRPVKVKQRAGLWDLQTGRRPIPATLGFNLIGKQFQNKQLPESSTEKTEPPKSPGTTKDQKKSQNREPSEKYLEVMANVVKRFIQTYGKGHGPSATDNLDQLKKDMSGLRQEVMTAVNSQESERQKMTNNIDHVEIGLNKSINKLHQKLTQTVVHQQLTADSSQAQMAQQIRQLSLAIGQMREVFAEQLEGIKQKVEAFESKETSKHKKGLFKRP